MREERLIIEQLNSGSYDSFKRLYDLWADRLYLFVFKLVKSEAIAQDIVQECFIKIWENRMGIHPEKSFKSYLFTIAYNRIVNDFRAQLRHPMMGEYIGYTSTLADENNAERHLSMEEFLDRLQQAKIKLTERQREVFEMSKEENLSHAEIEQRLGISNQAVRNYLASALRKIRSELKDYAPLLALYCLL